MIEPVMYFGIGFLAAALLGLLFLPLVHNRAVRLTMRRLEAATPLSIAEIRADKDQLRAEFAMSTRRLEMSVEHMKARTTNQLAEIGKKTDAVNQLKRELSEKTAAIADLETRDKALRDQLRSTEQEFDVKSAALHDAEVALANKQEELAKLIGELGEHSIIADSQRVELAALRTQVEAMKVSVAEYDRTVRDTEQRLTRERGDATATTADLQAARSKLASLASHAEDLERQLLVHTTEAQALKRRVGELEAHVGEQDRALIERDDELARLRNDAEAARKIEAELRSELAAAGGRTGTISDKHRSDIARLEAQLSAAIEERGKLQRELGTIKRDAESGWTSERVENALLRERINDVAAEVARLTAALEGPDSPIEAMLAAEAPKPTQNTGINGGRAETRTGGIDSPQESRSTLADRIRALQSTASRAASSS